MRRREIDMIDNLRTSYGLLNEVIRNPTRIGYIAVLSKVKPQSREIINLRLVDFKREIENEIRDIDRKILRKIGFDKMPDGLK